jgi:hypothetical protein
MLHIIEKLTEQYQPPFDAKLLQQLDIKLNDPAGTIQLEISQEQGAVHVRGVIPVEIMDDMLRLGSEIKSSLEEHGLSLGTFEMKDREGEESGTTSSDSVTTSETEKTHSSLVLHGSGQILNRKA